MRDSDYTICCRERLKRTGAGDEVPQFIYAADRLPNVRCEKQKSNIADRSTPIHV